MRIEADRSISAFNKYVVGVLMTSSWRIARQLAADPGAAGAVYDRFLQRVEPPLLTTIMDECGQRCAPAARILGLHRTTLKKKLDQYEIQELQSNS
jgi:DNA-binding NtrC family response regulator